MCYHIQIMHDEEQTQDPVHARQAFYQLKCIPEFNIVLIYIPLMDTEIDHVLCIGQLYYIFNVVPIKNSNDILQKNQKKILKFIWKHVRSTN